MRTFWVSMNSSELDWWTSLWKKKSYEINMFFFKTVLKTSCTVFFQNKHEHRINLYFCYYQLEIQTLPTLSKVVCETKCVCPCRFIIALNIKLQGSIPPVFIYMKYDNILRSRWKPSCIYPLSYPLPRWHRFHFVLALDIHLSRRCLQNKDNIQ